MIGGRALFRRHPTPPAPAHETWQGESNPESEFEWKKSDREHRSGAQATPQKPSRHDLQPTDDQERDEQQNSGWYADSLKWPPAVRRKTEERPDLTGRREVADPVSARQTETESQKDADDRGELHYVLGCGGRFTRVESSAALGQRPFAWRVPADARCRPRAT